MKRPYRNPLESGSIYWLWEPEPSIEGSKIHEWHLPIEVFEKLKAGHLYYGNTRAYLNEFDAVADYVDAVRSNL